MGLGSETKLESKLGQSMKGLQSNKQPYLVGKEEPPAKNQGVSEHIHEDQGRRLASYTQAGSDHDLSFMPHL